MKKSFLAAVLALLVLASASGCVPLIVGGAVGALGGYAASKDSIQGETDKPYENLWNAALTVARIRGNIKQESYARGYIELETDTGQVWIRLIRLTRATTRLRISARRYHLPNLGLAEELFVKIMEEAR